MKQSTIRLFLYIAAVIPALIIYGHLWLNSGSQATTVSEQLTLIGRFLGFTAAYCSLLQLILMSRLPILERGLGLERLIKFHRYNGFVVIYSMASHPIFLVFGYQFHGQPGLIRQYLDFVLHYPNVFNAFLASIVFFTVAVTSAVIVRRRLRHEVWYAVHIFVYVAILIAFGHQLANGAEFIGSPAFRIFWYALYITAFGIIAAYRVWIPIASLLIYRIRVDRIVAEADDIFSIYLKGNHLSRLKTRPGQFFGTRFYTKDLWYESHPFSLSQSADSNTIRLTIKAVGEYTVKLSAVTPGTYVSLDGPRGNVTWDRVETDHIVMVAGGIGITPMRSLVDAIPEGKSVTLLYGVHTRAEAIFESEFQHIPSLSTQLIPAAESGRISAQQVLAASPHPLQCDYFICGPDSMMIAISAGLTKAGVSENRIHTERFAYIAFKPS